MLVIQWRIGALACPSLCREKTDRRGAYPPLDAVCSERVLACRRRFCFLELLDSERHDFHLQMRSHIAVQSHFDVVCAEALDRMAGGASTKSSLIDG